MSVSPIPSTTGSSVGPGAGNVSASGAPLPPDLYPRPKSGPQPPEDKPFFFNPGFSNDTRVCVLNGDPDVPYHDRPNNVSEATRSTAQRCCSGVGIWNDVLFACRIETLENDANYTGCVNGTDGKGTDNTTSSCRIYHEYKVNMEDNSWHDLTWPQPWDNNTHVVITVLGARNSANSSSNTTTAEACCKQAQGTYGPELDPEEGQSKHGRKGQKDHGANGPGPGYGLVDANTYPPCLVAKEKEDAYRQCVLDQESNADVWAESWLPFKDGALVEDPNQDSAAASGIDIGIALMTLAIVSALLVSVA